MDAALRIMYVSMQPPNSDGGDNKGRFKTMSEHCIVCAEYLAMLYVRLQINILRDYQDQVKHDWKAFFKSVTCTSFAPPYTAVQEALLPEFRRLEAECLKESSRLASELNRKGGDAAGHAYGIM